MKRIKKMNNNSEQYDFSTIDLDQYLKDNEQELLK